MRPSLDKAALLLLLLLQAVVAIGATQRTVLVGHNDACDAHSHADSPAHAAARRTSAPEHALAPDHLPCTHADALRGAREAAPSFDCCPCPHIHLRLLDGPLTRFDPGTLKDVLPRASAPLRIAGMEPSSASCDPNARARAARDLALNHPPPPGLCTTVLLI